MTQAAKAQEPSMEEILASIRRIIADDDANKSALRAPEPARPEPVRSEPPRAEPPPAPPQPPVVAVSPPPVVTASPPPPPPPPRPAPEPEMAPPPLMSDAIADDSADILDLTESMTAKPDPAPAMPQFRTIDGTSDIGFDDAAERSAPRPAVHDNGEAGRLISSTTSAAVDSAFNALAHTVLVQNSRTLEDLVREMLRPMLKAWLDDNLPGLVERLVRAEIERVSRGRVG